MAITCDRFGFFNGIYGLEQKNWADYWRNIIPDGVIGGIYDEMEVIKSSTYVSGVSIKRGSAMVDNHRVWINTQKELQLPAAGSQNRIDLIVLRAVYGNSGASRVEIDCLTGTAAANPSKPTPTTVTGSRYEIELASVYRKAGDNNVEGQITDLRHVFYMPTDKGAIVNFTGTQVTCKCDREHRNNSPISNLTVSLPTTPSASFITGLCFSTASNFSGVTFRYYDPIRKNNAAVSAVNPTVKVIGDLFVVPNKRYNVVIYWDGVNYVAASKNM